MPKIEWLQMACADLMTIVDYISDDNPDAAEQLKDDIERTVGQLPEHPKMGRMGRVDGTRELVAAPNYIVVYQEASACIRILRVLHTARQWPPNIG